MARGVKPGDSHYLEGRFLLGVAHYYSGDFGGAQAAFQEVLEESASSEYSTTSERRNRAMISLPRCQNFRKAMEGDSSDPDYHCQCWILAVETEAIFEGAAASFRATLERVPDDADAITMLGPSHSEEGPRPGDPKRRRLERLKLNFRERPTASSKPNSNPRTEGGLTRGVLRGLSCFGIRPIVL